MADDYLALADMVNINNKALSDIQVSSLFDDAPALRVLAAVEATNGHLHTYLDLTQNPVVGSRAVNDGREHDSSIDTVRTVTCTIVDASFTVDQALAKIWRKGVQDLLDREAMRHLRAAMFYIEKQFFNGTTDGDASGFAGLCEKHAALSADYTVARGGTTALTSVYFVRSSPDEVAVVAGNGATIDIGDAVVNRIAGSSTGWLTAYVVPIVAYMGCQTGAIATSSVRIANIDAGSNTVDDDLLYSALKEFPSGRQPNYCFMNRRSLEQLRASRTATNATGVPAPRPTEIEGIPIVVTDAILSTETVVS
jgi:hypothetical protein